MGGGAGVGGPRRHQNMDAQKAAELDEQSVCARALQHRLAFSGIEKRDFVLQLDLI